MLDEHEEHLSSGAVQAVPAHSDMAAQPHMANPPGALVTGTLISGQSAGVGGAHVPNVSSSDQKLSTQLPAAPAGQPRLGGRVAVMPGMLRSSSSNHRVRVHQITGI